MTRTFHSLSRNNIYVWTATVYSSKSCQTPGRRATTVSTLDTSLRGLCSRDREIGLRIECLPNEYAFLNVWPGINLLAPAYGVCIDFRIIPEYTTSVWIEMHGHDRQRVPGKLSECANCELPHARAEFLQCPNARIHRLSKSGDDTRLSPRTSA